MSWCCRPCRCGTIVHTEDGRDPANACLHGDAICGACAPGDCTDCQTEAREPMPLADCIAELQQVLSRPDPWDNGTPAENPDDVFAVDNDLGWSTGGRRFA